MDVREQLLEAALKVFADAGFRGATTRRIAQEAGVNEVTLFRQFGSKEGLILEAVIRAVEATVPGVQLVRPGTLAMRARGPARYYGGEDAAAAALLATVTEHGVTGARVGVADGPFAAEQAARAARESPVRIVQPGASAAFIAPKASSS